MHSIFRPNSINFGKKHYLTVCHLLFSPSFGSISSSKPIGVRKVNRWTKSAHQRREDHYYEALAFSRHNIDLVFGEENMKPEQLTKAREKRRQ